MVQQNMLCLDTTVEITTGDTSLCMENFKNRTMADAMSMLSEYLLLLRSTLIHFFYTSFRLSIVIYDKAGLCHVLAFDLAYMLL